jgi:hypothetical protein
VSAPRYTIGIDLGTTHCALAYVDLAASDGEITSYGVLDVPQLTAPGAVESLPLLPSFLYLPHPDELTAGDLQLPWSGETACAVGEFARSRGAQTPIRLVSSAKSWLCHAGVDRRAAILPAMHRLKLSVCRRWRRRLVTWRICARPGMPPTPKHRLSSRTSLSLFQPPLTRQLENLLPRRPTPPVLST